MPVADIILPPWLPIASFRRKYIDSTGVSVGEYSGIKVTASKGGDRLGAGLEFTPQGYSSIGTALNARTMQQFMLRLRGRQNRAYITDPSLRRAGTFPTSELISNNTFAQGLTGWDGTNVDIALTVSDRMMRITRLGLISGQTVRYTGTAAVAHAPYVFRAFMLGGGGEPYWNLRLGTTSGNNDVGETVPNHLVGMTSLAVVNGPGTTLFPSFVDWPDGRNVFDFSETPYTSLSRCMLADVGVNTLLNSDLLHQATWFKDNSTATQVFSAGPGNTVCSQLTENTAANSLHAATQQAATTTDAQDVCFAVAVKAGTRSFVHLIISHFGDYAHAVFSLTDGAIGDNGVNGGFSNLRAPVAVSLGSGWWYLAIVARKGAGIPHLTANIRIGTNITGSGSTYTGDGTSHLFVWRATMAPSGTPSRLVQTTTTATAGTSATGSTIVVKGAPASGVDLLLPGDQIEIISSRGSELKIVTAAVHSNGAGLAHINFEPPLRGTVSADAPVIVHQPFGYYMVPEAGLEWTREPGTLRASLEIEESA